MTNPIFVQPLPFSSDKVTENRENHLLPAAETKDGKSYLVDSTGRFLLLASCSTPEFYRASTFEYGSAPPIDKLLADLPKRYYAVTGGSVSTDKEGVQFIRLGTGKKALAVANLDLFAYLLAVTCADTVELAAEKKPILFKREGELIGLLMPVALSEASAAAMSAWQPIEEANIQAKPAAEPTNIVQTTKIGGTAIHLHADQTLSVNWVGAKGRGSLFQIAAGGNVAAVNKLSLLELYAVLIAVKAHPFPLGAEQEVYTKVLEAVTANPAEFINEEGLARPLGELRRAVVLKAGEGFNAPTDMYLSTAVEAQEKKAEPSIH
jgi:hypothetical protein